jgi:hypothetical protein
MTKSIEMVWKEGFVNEAHLTLPKINDLYNRKSQNIVDKLQNMFSINIKAIIVGSLLMLALMSVIGAPFLGLYMCLLLAPLVVIAKKELLKSANLSKGQNSYDYLKNFSLWIKSSTETYSRYCKFFYPMVFIGISIQALASETGQVLTTRITESLPTSIIILGQPYYLLVLTATLTLVVARYAEALYRWDLNTVYGGQFKKLDEVIADMEELQGN